MHCLCWTTAAVDRMKNYTVHEDLQLYNNLIENAIRPVDVGRKWRITAPYLFANTHEQPQMRL